jgi:hypothetical protein
MNRYTAGWTEIQQNEKKYCRMNIDTSGWKEIQQDEHRYNRRKGCSRMRRGHKGSK